MTSIFIVRPFGKKSFPFKDGAGTVSQVTVDFEQVQKSLIDKAVEKCGLTCTTTEPIAKAGNIRLDMFQMLIAYDLVIADISIDNANAFYELGIRHGLRPKGTILIRFSTGSEVPFDLKTDRYIQYDRTQPETSVDRLASAIEETIAATEARDSKADSPVFLLLPDLDAPDSGKLLAVPQDFQDAVKEAVGEPAEIVAPTLALLGTEAAANPWAREGVRLVARAQTSLKDWKAARESWELVLKSAPKDIEANRKLGSVYWELKEPVKSSNACDRVLQNPQAEPDERADALAQLARNDKADWVAAFNVVADDAERRQTALGNPLLIKAFEGYAQSFVEDLNSYYAGINAFGLACAIVALAEREPEAWAAPFETEKKADDALTEYREQLERLRGAVRMSIERARRLKRKDEWVPPTEAQFALLTMKRATAVAASYRKARVEMGNTFAAASEARQVAVFHRLGLFVENCTAALKELGVAPADASPVKPTAVLPPRDRVIVATGHRADAKGREKPRFPNTQECIDKAREWLRQTVAAEKARNAGTISGIGGGASGADILFHEVCRELGIPTKVVLAIPEEDYRRESVADGGPDWLEKFGELVAANPPILLSDIRKVPSWAASIPGYSVHQRANIWMMEAALLRPNTDTTLVALWNGQAGDGPGGTADMVKLAGQHGARTLVKNTNDLFGLG
jgi:hypothetical protein